MAESLVSDFEVRASGEKLRRVLSCEMDRQIDAVASRFNASFSRKPNLGDYEPLELYFNGELCLTGFAEAYVLGYDKDKESRSVSGRSKTGDLVEGCIIHDSSEWLNQNVAQIAGDIIQPFGSRLVVRGDVGGSFTSFKVGSSEKAQAALRRLCDKRGLIMRDTPRGDLLISRPVWKKSPYKLVRRLDQKAQDHNVLRATVKRDNSKRFSEILVRGQDEGWNLNAAQVQGRAVDHNIKRYRPLVMAADKSVTSADAQRLAQWEMARRVGKALSWSGTVRGWMQGAGGPLWDVGWTIPVVDEEEGIDAELLITAIKLRSTEGGGAVAQVTCQPQEAFLERPVMTETGTAVQPWANLSSQIKGG
jgi:prophage tail gpP-like protein